MRGLSELAAAARARNEAHFAERNKGAVAKAVEPMKARIAELEAENAELKARVSSAAKKKKGE